MLKALTTDLSSLITRVLKLQEGKILIVLLYSYIQYCIYVTLKAEFYRMSTLWNVDFL